LGINNKPNEKHLDFVESTISRMGQNSFTAKAWCITVVTALMALYINQENTSCKVGALSVVVTLFFGAIDTYYLYLERGYRKLYDTIINPTDNPVRDFDMRIPKEERGFCPYLKALISISTGGFYILLIVGIIGITIAF